MFYPSTQVLPGGLLGASLSQARARPWSVSLLCPSPFPRPHRAREAPFVTAPLTLTALLPFIVFCCVPVVCVAVGPRAPGRMNF